MRRRQVIRLLLLGVMLTGASVWASHAIAGSFEVANWREARALKYRLIAAQFLQRATFGPDATDIDELAKSIGRYGRRRALEMWIDKQFETTATSHYKTIQDMLSLDGFEATQSGINHTRYRHHAWWHNAISSEDQLRQRVAWALSQIFVVSQNVGTFNNSNLDESGAARWLGITNYYDMLASNAFTNYRQILEDVTYHPVMGVYLSHVKNPPTNEKLGRFPDENYAREIQQLLSIGLYLQKQNGQYRRDREGNLIDTYDNETIRAFSRIFTGLSYARGPSFYGAKLNLHERMIMFDKYHDPGPKTLHNGEVVEVEGNGDKEIELGLDNIFNHRNVGPFFARLMIQRLVKSNPSKGYIRRVARAFNNNGQGVRGDMKAVVKAILLDREALRSQFFVYLRNPRRLMVIPRGTEYSSLREPVLRYAAFIRAFDPVTNYQGGYFMLQSQTSNMNQGPYLSPSVFNFYLPDYQPPGDIAEYDPSRRIPNGSLFGPEYEILTSVVANRYANRLRGDVYDATVNFTLLNNSNGKLTCEVSLDFDKATELAETPAKLLEYLDLLLCHGSMRDSTREIISQAITDATTNPATRAKGAILAVLTSPDCAVQN